MELFDEMLCAGHSDGHQDACLGNVCRKVFMFEVVDGVARANATPSIIILLSFFGAFCSNDMIVAMAISIYTTDAVSLYAKAEISQKYSLL